MISVIPNHISLKSKLISLDKSTTEVVFAEIIDQIREEGKVERHNLIRLLSERHPVYQGRSANEMFRMRGYIIASFEKIGLPESAMPYILEILESTFHPYLVAAAAKALRGTESPQGYTAQYLMKAIFNVWQGDRPISFEHYEVKWPLKNFTTAMLEILKTLEWMGAYAKSVVSDLKILLEENGNLLNSEINLKLTQTIEVIQNDKREVEDDCCDANFIFGEEAANEGKKVEIIDSNLVLEDHESKQYFWKDFFFGKPSVVAFFYTRCMNPRKCTLTIYNLVDIQKALIEAGISHEVNTAAITYDPKFDTSLALKSYGTSRQFNFDENNKMFRAPDGINHLGQAFNLGVNFNGSQVNSHRIELFLLDKNGKLIKSFLRNQAKPENIVQELKSHLESEKNKKAKKASNFLVSFYKKSKTGLNSISSIALPLFIAFFPKCPICWMAYLSVFGIASLETIPYTPWLFPLMFFLLALNLGFLYKIAKKRNGMIPFIFSCFGTVFLLLIAVTKGAWEWPLIPGISVLFIGALLNSLDRTRYMKLKRFIVEFYYHKFTPYLSKLSN